MEQEIKKDGVKIDNDKVWAVVAYIFFPIPLIFVKNRSTFLNYHINQGIILLIASVVGQIITNSLPYSLSIIGSLISLFILIEFIMGVLSATKMKMEPLPLIGKLYTFLK